MFYHRASRCRVLAAVQGFHGEGLKEEIFVYLPLLSALPLGHRIILTPVVQPKIFAERKASWMASGTNLHRPPPAQSPGVFVCPVTIFIYGRGMQLLEQ